MVTTEALTDGNASFLRAARSGNMEKIIEHLKGNIDINTSNANGLNALHLAAKEGHVHIVTELLKRGANVNAATKKGNTALHIASLAGQQEVARVLVSLGANVNVQSQNGFTPLYMAAQENHDHVVSFLLASGANQSLATEDGFTPLAVALQQGHDKVVAVLLENDTKGRVRLPALHIAAKKDDCKAATLLLQSDHNPDVTSKSGFTPLHIAAHYGNENIAKILLSKGADVNYAAKHQITPLHVASKWGKMNMVLLLLEKGANIEASTRDGLTPLHCAARSGHDQVVDVLLEKGAPFLAKTKNGLAPLHMASQGDHVDSARILLYHKAPVDDVTVDYLTALHVAAHCGHVKVAKLLLDRKADPNARALNGFTPLHIACKKNRIKVVELLLKHGASIEATTESGLTPLHVASFMGCMNIVIYLIQNGANPDVPTVRGETPLHLAARANQTDIIRILLRNGASVDARAREDQTPLHIAARLGNVDIVSLLLQHGAAVDATTKDMYTALHIAAKEDQEEVASSLLDHGAALAATTKKGFTPLHLAAKYGNIKVARLLIQKSAAVDAQGKNGVTPLHVAAHYDHVNVSLLLLDKGASPHATAKNGYTPLHIAAKKNQMDIASTLLEYGAKTNSESKAGFTPLHLSSQEGHVDMSSLLIENKADVNHKANNGLTPLHLCAQDDRVDVAHILVGHKAEIGPQTKAGYTPLHVAAHFGQMNMVKFLLHHGADVHTTTSHGYTSLHQAAQQGHTLAVNLLLENQASPNVTTCQGQTPLSIAQRLGYISVVETLKVVTETTVTTTTTTVTEEKYKVVAPETMQETFMTDSEDEGGADFDEAAIFGKPTHATHVYLPYVEGHNFLMSEEAMLGDQSYGYLTADEMKSLGDDSLPIDVTKDEKHQDILHSVKQFGAPMVEEDKLSPQHATPVEGGFSEKFSPDNIDLERAPMHVGSRLKWKTFLVSFMVDARGGAMRGCRHSGVRVIIPPRKASMPMRITCRYLRKEKLIHPPPLMEGEACASRILEMGPVGAKFLGPVIIEVPHFASTRGKEREITILRSDTGESWKEHTLEASEEAVQEVLNESFEGEELSALEDLNTNRITRILTTDFPQYFAVVSRVRQEVHGVGPEGGMVSSTVVPQVQAIFPEGALTKKIRVGLQAQPIAPELVAKLLGNRVAVSPIVTVEPRRRKFHKPITLTIPVPQATTKGMINQYSGDAPTLRLLCSITGSTKSGGSSKAQWEDVTGSTPLTFVNDCVSFTTTVSARFWLMDCRQVNEVTRFATELYQEAVYVPFMSKFVIFAKRYDSYEAQLRVFCCTDDKEDKTLECQEHFTEVAKSRDVEVLEGKLQYLEFAGNIAPVTKSGEQLKLAFSAFHENRLPFTIRVKDPHAEPMGRVAFMREPRAGRGEPPQVPICNLNVALPDITLTEGASADVIELVKLEKRYDFIQEAGLSKPELIHRADLRLSDIAQGLDKDWVVLAKQLDVSEADLSRIQADATCDQPEQALMMLRLWLQKSGSKATGNELEKGLRKINREDIIKNCMFNVELVTDDVEKAVAKVHLDQSGFDVFKEELGSSREASMRRGASLDISYDEQDIMKEAESAAETSSETGSLFERDQISQALTDDKVDQKDESSKFDAEDDDNAAALFPKCKKPTSKHAEYASTPEPANEFSIPQNATAADCQSNIEDATTNITQKHFVRTHDFWPPDKLVEIHSSDGQTESTTIDLPLPSSDTLIQTKNVNPIENEKQNIILNQEVLLSKTTSDSDPKSIESTGAKTPLNIDLLQKNDGDKSIDPSDLGYCSMDKDSNVSPNSTSESIRYVNLSQLPDVVSHDVPSPSQNISSPFATHSVQIEELKHLGSMQSSEMEQTLVQSTATIQEAPTDNVNLSSDARKKSSEIEQILSTIQEAPSDNVNLLDDVRNISSEIEQISVRSIAESTHEAPIDNVNESSEIEQIPVPSIATIYEAPTDNRNKSSEIEQISVPSTATIDDELTETDNLSGDVRNTSSLEVDQNCYESSDSCDVYTAGGKNVHELASEIIAGNSFGDENSNLEDARIRRASKTPPPSPADKPGDDMNKGVEILLSHSSLEEKLREPVDLAHKSQEILGREELQVRLTESETWPSLELDTSQVSISSLPDDEKSEPTTATASDAAVVVDTAAGKDITFVERIEKSEFEGPGLATHIIQKTTHMTMYSSSDAPCSEEAQEYKSLKEAGIGEKESIEEVEDSAVVFELVSAKGAKPSGLGQSPEAPAEAADVDQTAVEEQVVQDNLVEYIAGLSDEGNLQQALASEQSMLQIQNLESSGDKAVENVPVSTVGETDPDQVHAQKPHEESLIAEEEKVVVEDVQCAFDNTAFAGAELIDKVDQMVPLRSRSPYEVIRDDDHYETSQFVTEQTIRQEQPEDLGTTRTTHVFKQMEVRHRPILQNIPSEISEEDLVEREIDSPLWRRDSDVLDSPTESQSRPLESFQMSSQANVQTHILTEGGSTTTYHTELPSEGLWDTRRTVRTTVTHISRTVGEPSDTEEKVASGKDTKAEEIVSPETDTGIATGSLELVSETDTSDRDHKSGTFPSAGLSTGEDVDKSQDSVIVTTASQSFTDKTISADSRSSNGFTPREQMLESQADLSSEQHSSGGAYEISQIGEATQVLNGPGEVDYHAEYDYSDEFAQTKRSGGVFHTDRPLQISSSASDDFKKRHYSSVSDDVIDSEIGEILRSDQQFDDIIERPMTPEPPLDEIEFGISISAKTLTDLTKLELDEENIERRVFPDYDDDRILSPPLSPGDLKAGFAYGMQFEKDVLDAVEEAMDLDSDPYSEEKEPSFSYGMRFEREPEDDDIPCYGDLYTHEEEDEDALENGDKVKVVTKPKRESDFDILAGRKYFTKNVEMDELSMSSLQEFERLEAEIVSGRKSSVGSIDSLNGKPVSKSGDHDDVSMSSLTEFERLEKECIEVDKINPAMQESTLSEIEEGHESQASETSQENKSDGCKDDDLSIVEGYDHHLDDIEKIILKADSGEKEELSFQYLISQTTKSSSMTKNVDDTDRNLDATEISNIKTDAPSTEFTTVTRMHVLQRSQDSFSKSEGRNDDIDQDSLHDELSLKPDSLADDTKHEYLDSLHEGRCDDADSLQGDIPDEMRDSLFEDRHLEDDSLRDMDILPDESSLSMESSLAAVMSHDSIRDDQIRDKSHDTHEPHTLPIIERAAEGTSSVKRAEIIVSELPKGDIMLSSTDSLEQSSSAAAAFHFESESAMSTSLTGALASEDNTMISSTDTLEHEGRITFRYEDIPIDDLEILIKDGRQVIVDSEGNVQTEYDVKHFLDNSGGNINNEFNFCSKGFVQSMHPSGSTQVESVVKYMPPENEGRFQTETDTKETSGRFESSYSEPDVEVEEIHTTDEFGNPKVIKKIKKVVQTKTQFSSSSSSENVEEKLKEFLREHAAGDGAGIGEEVMQEERSIDDKGNVVLVRTVQQQVLSHPEVHSRTFTGPDAAVMSEEYVERFKELDPTDDVCEYEKIDEQGNVVRVTQQVVIKPEVHSISFSGPNAHQQMEDYMKRFTPMSQNGSRTKAGESSQTFSGAQISTTADQGQEYIPSETETQGMSSTTFIKTTVSNIVPESSEQFVVRTTTTSTTVSSTDGTVKTNGSPEQKSSSVVD